MHNPGEYAAHLDVLIMAAGFTGFCAWCFAGHLISKRYEREV